MLNLHPRDSYDFVREAVSNLESALVLSGAGSPTLPNWEHYRQIAAALINNTGLLMQLERERE